MNSWSPRREVEKEKQMIAGQVDTAGMVQLLLEVREECRGALENHGDFHSAHEGYAVILEELDELWEEVRKKKTSRDPRQMRRECVQVAAMAMKFAMKFGGPP